LAAAYLAPNWFTRKVFNPLAMRLGIAGTETLTVHGRRSGRPMRVPVIPVEHRGDRYLVSTRGESGWVRNLRAARGGKLTRRGRTLDFAADEVPVDSRPPVLSAYRDKVGREAQRYFDRLPDPADHPVFLIDAEAGRSQSATAGS
jgi:deazaflavin-dependent oxidoreductase (nitroreductase family)